MASLELMIPTRITSGDFHGFDDVNRYCHQMARAMEALAVDLEVSAAVTRKRLEQLPTGPRGLIARGKARAVARHLERSSDSCYAAARRMGAVMPMLRRALDQSAEKGRTLPKRWAP
jgi:hypothetical protein